MLGDGTRKYGNHRPRARAHPTGGPHNPRTSLPFFALARPVRKRCPKFVRLQLDRQIHLQLGHPELALDFFRRAVAVNPNLEGAAAMIPVLEELLRGQQPQRT